MKPGSNKETGLSLDQPPIPPLSSYLPEMVDIQKSVGRHLYSTSSAVYPAKSEVDGAVEPGDQSTMKGKAGEVSSCAYLIGSNGKVRVDVMILEQPRKQGAGQRIWYHTCEDFCGRDE